MVQHRQASERRANASRQTTVRSEREYERKTSTKDWIVPPPQATFNLHFGWCAHVWLNDWDWQRSSSWLGSENKLNRTNIHTQNWTNLEYVPFPFCDTWLGSKCELEWMVNTITKGHSVSTKHKPTFKRTVHIVVHRNSQQQKQQTENGKNMITKTRTSSSNDDKVTMMLVVVDWEVNHDKMVCVLLLDWTQSRTQAAQSENRAQAIASVLSLLVLNKIILLFACILISCNQVEGSWHIQIVRRMAGWLEEQGTTRQCVTTAGVASRCRCN